MIKILMSAVALTALTTSAFAYDQNAPSTPYYGYQENSNGQPYYNPPQIPNAPVIPVIPRQASPVQVYLSPPPAPVVVCWYNCR